MRAQKVYENLEFERGRDPKRAMGIGLRNSDKLADYVIENLPEILGTEEIPDNIIRSDTYVFKPAYATKIEKWLAKLYGFYCDRDGNFWESKEDFEAGKAWRDFDSIAGMSFPGFYQTAHRKLKDMGYQNG